MILLVGGEKGGSGKVVSLQNLAVYIKQNFKQTSSWSIVIPAHHFRLIQARNNDPSLSSINCIQLYGKIRNDLLSLNERFDYVIVDCGGQDNFSHARSHVGSHPCQILSDLKKTRSKTLPHMEDMLSTCKMVNPKMIATIVLTQMPCASHNLNVF